MNQDQAQTDKPKTALKSLGMFISGAVIQFFALAIVVPFLILFMVTNGKITGPSYFIYLIIVTSPFWGGLIYSFGSQKKGRNISFAIGSLAVLILMFSHLLPPQ